MTEPIPAQESNPASTHELHPVEAAPELVRLGANLRKAREDRGLALDTLADQLRMGRDQLQALELADLGRLPEKVFVVAQARRVATALGMEADPLIEDLRRAGFAAARDGGRPGTAPTKRSFLPGQAARRRAASSLTPFFAGTVAALGTVAVLLAGAGPTWRQLGNLPKPPLSPTSPKSPAPSAATPAARRLTAIKPPGAAVLLLSSLQGSWISVRAASGESLFQGNLKGARSFPLNREIQVLAGRPDLVTVRVGTAEPRPFGPIDQVVWRSFRSP